MSGNSKDVLKPRRKLRQRLLVLVLIVATALPAAWLGFASRSLKLTNIRFDFWGIENHYVFESDNKNKADFMTQFRNKTNSLTGIYGFTYYNLKSDEQMGLYSDRRFEAGSFMDLPVIAAFWAQVEQGKLEPSEVYVLQESDKVDGEGSLQTKPQGYKIKFSDLVALIGEGSDSIAYRVVRKRIGEEAVQKILVKAEMDQTDLLKSQTTPQDLANFYRNLLSGKLVAQEHVDLILQSLKSPICEDFLSTEVLESASVSHICEQENRILYYAGVISGNRTPYILVLMSEGVKDSEAEKVFPSLSQLFYQKSLDIQ